MMPMPCRPLSLERICRPLPLQPSPSEDLPPRLLCLSPMPTSARHNCVWVIATDGWVHSALLCSIMLMTARAMNLHDPKEVCRDITSHLVAGPMKDVIANSFGKIFIYDIFNLFTLYIDNLGQNCDMNYEIITSELGCPEFMPRTSLMGFPHGLAL